MTQTSGNVYYSMYGTLYNKKIAKDVKIRCMYDVLYSTLLHLPPLRFHCVGGCWDRTQDSCDYVIGCQML
jgi:hypothetical protein